MITKRKEDPITKKKRRMRKVLFLRKRRENIIDEKEMRENTGKGMTEIQKNVHERG